MKRVRPLASSANETEHFTVDMKHNAQRPDQNTGNSMPYSLR